MRRRIADIPKPVLAGLLVFAASWGLFAFSTQPLTGYEPETGAVTEGLVLEGHLRDKEDTLLMTAQVEGRDGHHVARAGLPQPLLEAPFFAAGHLADQAFGHFGAFPNDYAFLWFFNPLMAAIAAAALFALIWQTRRSLRWAAATAFLFAVASIAWPYSKIGMETTFMAAIVTAFALAIWARGSPSRLSWTLTGLATGTAMATKPYALVSIVPIALLLWPAFRDLDRERKLRLGLAFCAPILLWIAAIGWYNWYRFGAVTDFGYEESSLTLSAPVNFLGLLFSPGKGLVFYSPLVVLGALGMPRLWRADRWLAAALILLLVALTVVSASSTYWGDEVWGPRYIVPAAWTLLVPIAWWADTLTRRRVLAAVASVAIAVQVVGVAVEYGQYLPVLRQLTGVPILRDREGVPTSQIPYGNDAMRWVPLTSQLLVQAEGLVSSQVIEPLGGDGITVTYSPFEGRERSVDLSDPKARMPLDFWWSAAPAHKTLACLLALLILAVSIAAWLALYRVCFGRGRPAGGAGMSAEGEIEVSVVMPCLDEAESLAACIEMAREGLERAGAVGEIVIADNGSKDGSQEIARGLGARVVEVPRRGYGAALMGGFEAARGRFVVMGDADASYDFGAIAPFLERLRAGDDLVMGNRFEGGVEDGAMPFLNRHLGNPALSFVGRLLFRTGIGDFHCGLRAFRRDALPTLDLQSDGMELASEMVVKATLNGLAVSEVPTTLAPAMRSRKPHLRPWRDGWRHLRFLLLFSPRWLFFYPGLALMALGAAIMIALLPGELRLLGTGFDVHTLVYASAMVVVGYQAMLFAVFARIYAMTSGFLPGKPWIRRMSKRLSLEAGALVGVGLIAAGIALSVVALAVWGDRGFAELDYRDTLRLVVPASTLLILGVQTVLASFFVSILEIEHSPPRRLSA